MNLCVIHKVNFLAYSNILYELNNINNCSVVHKLKGKPPSFPPIRGGIKKRKK